MIPSYLTIQECEEAKNKVFAKQKIRIYKSDTITRLQNKIKDYVELYETSFEIEEGSFVLYSIRKNFLTVDKYRLSLLIFIWIAQWKINYLQKQHSTTREDVR